MMKKTYLGVGVVVLLVAAGIGFFYYLGIKDEGILTTLVVKVSDTAKLGEKISYNGLSITPLQVTEDSRCPVDVQCIWAGRVMLNANLERSDKTQEFIFDSLKQNPVTFEGKTVFLKEVGAKDNYTFTFSKED